MCANALHATFSGFKAYPLTYRILNSTFDIYTRGRINLLLSTTWCQSGSKTKLLTEVKAPCILRPIPDSISWQGSSWTIVSLKCCYPSLLVPLLTKPFLHSAEHAVQGHVQHSANWWCQRWFLDSWNDQLHTREGFRQMTWFSSRKHLIQLPLLITLSERQLDIEGRVTQIPSTTTYSQQQLRFWNTCRTCWMERTICRKHEEDILLYSTELIEMA